MINDSSAKSIVESFINTSSISNFCEDSPNGTTLPSCVSSNDLNEHHENPHLIKEVSNEATSDPKLREVINSLKHENELLKNQIIKLQGEKNKYQSIIIILEKSLRIYKLKELKWRACIIEELYQSLKQEYESNRNESEKNKTQINEDINLIDTKLLKFSSNTTLKKIANLLALRAYEIYNKPLVYRKKRIENAVQSQDDTDKATDNYLLYSEEVQQNNSKRNNHHSFNETTPSNYSKKATMRVRRDYNLKELKMMM